MEPFSKPPIDTSNWVVQSKIIMGTMPRDDKQVMSLYDFGTRMFVCLCHIRELSYKEYPELVKSLPEAEFVYYPIPNMGIISDEKVRALVKIIRSKKEKGIVYVHCRAGIGRSGTICAILYGMEYKFPSDKTLEEINRLRRTRRTINSPTRECPETEVQRNQVKRILDSPLEKLWKDVFVEKSYVIEK